MQLSIIYLVITTLIYVSLINSQPYRGTGMPMEDLVAAIATAAINGAIPFNKINLRNPKTNGEPLRIPILLIKSNDLRAGRQKFNAKYSNGRQHWNQKNGNGFYPNKNDRNFPNKDFSPKPRFPTNGMKVVPAPKLYPDFIGPKKGPRPPIKVPSERYQNKSPIIELPERYPERQNEKIPEHLNARLPDRQNDRYPDRQNERYPDRQNERYPDRQNERYPDRSNERLPEGPNERLPDRQVERYPLRQNERLPDREPENGDNNDYDREPERPQNQEQDDYEDNKPLVQKSVVRTPTIVRHVYGSNLDMPTIPPRYLKDMPRTQSSDVGEKYKNPLQNLPPISEILPPFKQQQSDSYSNEPIVNHKFVNIGDVYRKANNEEEDFVNQEEVNNNDDSLEGYAKDPYDKQLVNTLKNLMASSKERHPLNIGGLTETESVKQDDNYKPSTTKVKSIDSYFTNSNSGQQYDSFSQSTAQRQPQYDSTQTTSKQNIQLIPQSLMQYSSQSQTSPQSRIPESLFSPLSQSQTIKNFGSDSASYLKSYTSQSLTDNYKSPASDGETHMIQLLPGQVPILPDLSTKRRPVPVDLDYDTSSRPLSPSSFFSEQNDQKSSGYALGKAFLSNADQAVDTSQQGSSSYQTQQPLKTYVVTGIYSKKIQDQDKNVEQVEQYDDKVTQNSEISETYAQLLDGKSVPTYESIKKPIYVQLSPNIFLTMGSNANLINTKTRNNRPPQKVSKSLLFKTQELNDDKRVEAVINDGIINYNNSTVTDVTAFSCDQKSHGFYADVKNNCEVYYQCNLGNSYKFTCPNGTRFDQKRQLCDWPEKVYCDVKQESLQSNGD